MATRNETYLYACTDCGSALVGPPRADMDETTCPACGHHSCEGLTFTQEAEL